MAEHVIGGLITSTVLRLVILPAISAMVLRRRQAPRSPHEWL